MSRSHRRPGAPEDAHAWAATRLAKCPTLGTDLLPLCELPPHPKLAWKCTRMMAALIIPAEVWDDWFSERH